MARRSIMFAAALLLALAMVPVASADEHGTDRPIWSNQSGEVGFNMVGVPSVDPCPVVAVSDSYGTMSHLGKVWIHWEHCSPVTLPGPPGSPAPRRAGCPPAFPPGSAPAP